MEQLPEWLCYFASPEATHERPSFSTSSSAFGIVTIFHFGYFGGCVVIARRGLIRTSGVAKDARRLPTRRGLVCPLYKSPSGTCLVVSLGQLLIRVLSTVESREFFTYSRC